MRIRTGRLNITAKLVIPFVVIFGIAITLLGAGFIRSQNGALLRVLDQKAEMLARNLAVVLSDPFATPEYVHQMLAAVKKTDADVAYAMMMSLDRQTVMTTDRAWDGRPLIGGEFDLAALKAESFTRRATPSAGVFEVLMPVQNAQAYLGVVRIGVSTHQIQATARRAAWFVAGLGAVVLFVGAATYVGLARRVVRPLNASIQRLEELASGEADLTLRLPVTSRDEAGRLAQTLNRFLDKLHQLVSDIRGASARLDGGCRRVSGAVRDLAGTAQQQAATLEESAASLEEITATVKQNADHARHASRLATGAQDAAEKGGRVAVSAVASMREITSTSQRIGEIVGVIDDIAFQTNLLALNAAVEAARAGEQGRGFAVVAGEVRSLAQRSASAAREIKALIRDSLGKVEAGAGLVNESGRTLEEIVGAVKQVTAIIADIAAACHEQSGGIDQVNRAVGQMDHVVQANAAKTESVSSTVQVLAADARELQVLVGRFTLGGEQTVEPAEPAGGESDTEIAGPRAIRAQSRPSSLQYGTHSASPSSVITA